MLTADLVHARRHKGALKLQPLNDERRERALALAEQIVDVARSHVGQTRGELLEAWGAIRVGGRDRKLADGLKKLVDDRLEFAVDLDVEPIALRREVFELATARRRDLEAADDFDRDGLLAEVAGAHGLSPDEVERGLFADLKSEHRLLNVACPPPRALVAGYDMEQARAVLLRATGVTARIRGASPEALRALFHRLKFFRLLFTASREPDGALRLELDGPMSLFDSVTKYGLALANALPAICACGGWSIEASLRWGKRRDPLTFALEGDARADVEEPARLRDEVQTLHEKLAAREGPFEVALADDLVDLPGIGLCVPDLALTHRETGEVVLFESLGFWSRDAVWRRVELVQGGLEQKILFAVSSRLRVSEGVLDDDASGALYVYKGVMSAKQVEDRALRLLG